MRISDWSSDVCSSDLRGRQHGQGQQPPRLGDVAPEEGAEPGRRLVQPVRTEGIYALLDPADHRFAPCTRIGGCALFGASPEIGRAHVCTPATNAHLVCRLLLETKHM